MEICARDARLVGVVEDDAAVSEESWCAWRERDKLVGVVCAEAWERGDFAVLAAQIADLAARWVVYVAWWVFAASVRVEVSLGVGAISA